MKKGFTLIELLAVIIILAILMVVAVPNVLSTLNDAKEKTFKTQAQSIWKAAEQKFIIDSLTGVQQECYDLSTPLDLGSVSDSISYVVEMDFQTGKVTSINVLDTTQNFKASGTTPDGLAVSVETSDAELTCDGASYLDGTIANAPKLGNLIPIKYDGTKWVYADKTKKWYDYGNKEWANAVVLTSGVRKSVGDTISENDIDLWFVWLPRYEYKIPAASKGISGTPNAIDIKFISSSQTTPTSGYNLHPGFKFGSTWKSGLWIGKFESSAQYVVGEQALQNQKIKIKANIIPWRNTKIANMYSSALNMDSAYSLVGMDSHMTRYTEWTAISYITNSLFGNCTSTTNCPEIENNNIEGKTQGSDETAYLTGEGDYKTNIAQSNTGNITGIYDLNGGAWEVAGAYIQGSSTLGVKDGFGAGSVPSDTKYIDIFTSNNLNAETYSVVTKVNGETSMNGILSETMSDLTSITTWNSDTCIIPKNAHPWFMMGGNWRKPGPAGIFASSAIDGDIYSNVGFRVALVNN